MSRRIIIITLLLTVISVLTFSNINKLSSTQNFSCKTHRDTYSVRTLAIDADSFQVLVADTPNKWEYGLMNVESKKDICGNDGMFFTFPIAVPQTFWNKNTLVDLNMYWMKGEKKVGQGKLPAITESGLTTISSPEAVDGVVEIITP
ncbi:DUF192 domain-containing protein [Candidatus Woesebacteria bacterium]|nr:DUF192 domain-containing protein [Candidatus Woesebacteria bacterium]